MIMLPIVTAPIYSTILPSTGKKVRFRPFLVQEEKLLLIAAQSGDKMDIASTTLQVVEACIADAGIDVGSLPFFDIDHLITAMRAKSVGEKITVNFTCKNGVDNNPCGHTFPIDFDITEAKTVFPETNMDIQINDQIGVHMKYPKYLSMKLSVNPDDNHFDQGISTIYACVDFIFDKEKTYPIRDMTRADFNEWASKLSKPQMQKLLAFTDTFPTFHVEAKHICEKCGFNHSIKYDDFDAFFLS